MSVPPSIERVLDNHDLPRDFMPASELGSLMVRQQGSSVTRIGTANRVCARLLRCSENSLALTLHSTDTLLDIRPINEVSGKNYEALAGVALQKTLAGMGAELNSVPAIPVLKDIPAFVDKSLLDFDTLFLDTGVADQYLRLERSHFLRLVDQAAITDISKPLEILRVPQDTAQDEADIRKSVSLFTERRIKQRLEETLDIPPLPATANKIIQLRVDPHADISDLTDIVELDASLSAQIVSWAGSPYYSAPGAIKSIHDAIVRVLGFDVVLNLALGLSLGKTLKMPSVNPGLCLPYWQQSVYTAVAAEALVTAIPRAHRPSFGTAYLAGLLNNFGYLIISEVFDNHFKALCDCIDANPHTPVQAAERHLIGVDRNQLAAWLMKFWNLPEAVVTALRFQANPEYDGEDWQYPLLLFVAGRLLQQQGVFTGSGGDKVPAEVFARLKLDPMDASEAIRNVIEQSEELMAIAGQMQ